MEALGGTRELILDLTMRAVLAKGLDATTIDEIAGAAGITRNGLLYHFPSKNALAVALIERHIAVELAIVEAMIRRARKLSDDPLQVLLIALRLLAELFEEMPGGHPGCVVASLTYQERLYDTGVRRANRRSVVEIRTRFRALLEEIAARYRPAEPVDLTALADSVNTVVEGGLVLNRALGNPSVVVRQIMLLRIFLKQMFQPGASRAAA